MAFEPSPQLLMNFLGLQWNRRSPTEDWTILCAAPFQRRNCLVPSSGRTSGTGKVSQPSCQPPFPCAYLLGGCSFTSSNSPNWLVGKNHFTPVFHVIWGERRRCKQAQYFTLGRVDLESFLEHADLLLTRSLLWQHSHQCICRPSRKARNRQKGHNGHFPCV